MNQIDMTIVRQIMPKFEVFLQNEGQKWIDERDEKDKFFAKHFSEQAVEELDEGTLRELIHLLWSFSGWTNKDFLLQEMLQSGLPPIRHAFRYLLYSNDPVKRRLDYMKRTVRMMGVASISEVLSHKDHQKFPIWNRRSRRGLVRIGIPDTQLPKTVQISGAQYEAFCLLAQQVCSQIRADYPDISDLFKLDFFLFFISLQDSDTEIAEPLTEAPFAGDFEHGAVIDQLLELGDGLGFEVAKEFAVSHGCRIDAIWKSRVANLGNIAYAFEVHRKGSRDSAILNLQRVRRDPAVQKVILVSSSKELDQFKLEIATLDESFRNSVGYLQVQALQNALNHLQGLKDILTGLGLLGKAL